MNNSDMPASPAKVTIDRDDESIGPFQFGNDDFECEGLTKREAFAMAAMQGLCANQYNIITESNARSNLAKEAVQQADALLKELEK